MSVSSLLSRLTCALAGALVLTLCACAGMEPTEAKTQDIATLYAKLEADFRSAVISVHQPYDTVQLHAVPRNPYGEALPTSETLRFRKYTPNDTTFEIDSLGMVHARFPSRASRVVIELTVNGMMRADTVLFAIRADLPIRTVARTEYFPLSPDSNWVWSSSSSPGSYRNWLRLFDTNGSVIPMSDVQAVYNTNFWWDDETIFQGMGNMTYASLIEVLGETYIHTKFYAYGKVFTDSVLFRRVEPTARFVVVNEVFPANGERSIAFYPSVLRARPGNTIFFINRKGYSNERLNGPCGTNTIDDCRNRQIYSRDSGAVRIAWVDSVDVVFDDPTHIVAGDSYGTMTFLKSNIFPADGGTGNIPPFSRTDCYVPSTTAGPERCTTAGASFLGIDPGVRARKFTTPGTYRYSSTRFPGVGATIIVEE